MNGFLFGEILTSIANDAIYHLVWRQSACVWCGCDQELKIWRLPSQNFFKIVAWFVCVALFLLPLPAPASYKNSGAVR
jgi:hypothetical protein